MNRRIGIGVAALLSILATTPAWAGGSVSWSLSVHGSGGYPPPAYVVPRYYPAPVYAPPIVVAPPPVYVYPAPVYPAPVIVGRGYHPNWHSHWDHGYRHYGHGHYGHGHLHFRR